MKNNIEVKNGFGVFQLSEEYFVQSLEAVNVQIRFSPLEVHGKQESGQSKIMIAMKMTDEDVADFMNVEIVPGKLELSPFATVNEKIVILIR